MMPEIAVIGGGAAGLAAAIFAAREGASVSLYEKNEKVGKKLYITGKGRCNFTNLCDTQQFLSKVMRNPRFLYSALSCLSPEDMIALIEENGCRTKVERGQRAFPVSDKASDITRALVRAAERAGARILTRQGVRSLRFSDIGGRIAVSGLELESGETAEPGAVIIATGGLSYPSTGSTGDGYVFAGKAGHHLLQDPDGGDEEEGPLRGAAGAQIRERNGPLRQKNRAALSGEPAAQSHGTGRLRA